MHCNQDWQIILDNIRARMQEQHFKLWHKHQQIISESAEVLFVEEDTYLIPLVMELHHWPVRNGLVPCPAIYQWSSDQFYRHSKNLQQASSGLATHRMLQRLGKQRFNSTTRYERMMEQFEPWPIEQAKNRLYQALASDSYITMYLRGKKPNLVHSNLQIISMRQQAEKLICDILGAPIEQIQHPRFRRQYYQVEPLTIWLLIESKCEIHQLTLMFDLDETVIQGWLRSISSVHPESLLTRIRQRWQEDLELKDSVLLSHVS